MLNGKINYFERVKRFTLSLVLKRFISTFEIIVKNPIDLIAPKFTLHAVKKADSWSFVHDQIYQIWLS